MSLTWAVVIAIFLGLIADFLFYMLEAKWSGIFSIMILRVGFSLVVGYLLSRYMFWGKAIFITISIVLLYRKVIEPRNIRAKYLVGPGDNLESGLQKMELELSLNLANKMHGTNYTIKDAVNDKIRRQNILAVSTLIISIAVYFLFFFKDKHF